MTLIQPSSISGNVDILENLYLIIFFRSLPLHDPMECQSVFSSHHSIIEEEGKWDEYFSHKMEMWHKLLSVRLLSEVLVLIIFNKPLSAHANVFLIYILFNQVPYASEELIVILSTASYLKTCISFITCNNSTRKSNFH